ncbi:MAG: ATP-dependent zinc metalloprotease FtsH [Candidatus Uhrbacteria bacterium GW2011_GWD2_52_7]|uniref:ATP-dependent zinc metalloprotease FtsH n=1 Tax=Candidatus Uhrbacteria bacterium GW2011_GWD2_52_7 TaxID=1618989 RepID=A0A0G1XHA6_9BACT|nr:MAG: ATP-dependent zinc metalloprotease FtsH [Candidatus Uhrbacteria bacterium GW2011_GWD2_52_7]
MKPLSKNIIIFLLSLVVLGVVFSSMNIDTPQPQTIDTATLVQKIEAKEISKIDIVENNVTAFGNDGVEYVMQKEDGQPLNELLTDFGVDADELKSVPMTVKDPGVAQTLVRSVLPTLLFVIGLSIVLWFFIRQMQGANNRAMTFGQSNAREVNNKKNRITFNEVAGNPEAKEELAEIVEFLKTPKKFADLGAKIPKGVLLMGPPGTGKTLIARAVAGEANVPFFHISGSEFVEMFVGVGASRVRDLFSKAKKAAPCIIFIDEIDAVGRQRGAGLGGGHDEREQTLNQILVEMDGFDPNLGVIVVAATNRPDVLDPALLRPGRFDRRVILDRPDLKDREAILKIHAENKPLAEDVNLRRVAERTTGLSGADLMNVMNEAAIFAARRDRKHITQQDLLDSIEKVLLGPERKSHILSEGERMITAYHEAGHAVVGHMLPHCDEVHKVSIISRGRAAGYTMSIPDEDKKMHSRAEFVDELAMMLGGYMAEQEIFGDLTTGASNDLQRATHLARELVTQYGMSDVLGPRTYGARDSEVFLGKQLHEQRDYSESVAQTIDEEITKLLMNAKETARGIIRDHRSKMDKVVGELLEKETIEKETFETLLGPAAKAPKLAIKPANVS